MGTDVVTPVAPWVAVRALTEGLEKGYVGGGKFFPASLGAVSFKMFFCSLPQLVEKSGLAPTYFDHYHFEEQTGFGFEYIEIEDPVTKTTRHFARVYAGGTVPKEKLVELGLEEEDVVEALKVFLKALGDQTRLDQAKSTQNGKWIYVYEILKDNGQIFGFPFVLAEEEIYYFARDGSGIRELVYTHYIILIEIK